MARASLGPDLGKYGFRLWEATLPGCGRVGYRLWARAANTAGEVQGMTAIWNPGGYMRNPAPSIAVHAA
ncbi:hypothetical protein [Sphingomonas adhaesiva]|uniref:hypothetical protein n=1 Tax=Sphingomonas adhaesiva TaxID=28212 RepID=UPI002FF8E4DD